MTADQPTDNSRSARPGTGSPGPEGKCPTNDSPPAGSGPGLRVERDGDVLHLRIDRAHVRNALDLATSAALADAVVEAGLAGEARAVLISGAGDHFCAGADLTAANAQPRPARIGHIHRSLPHRSQRLIRAVWEAPLPVVAAVRGAAVGLGCNLALACDYVVAGAGAWFTAPFVRRGLSADTGAAFLLPRLVGLARAKEMLLLGRRLDAPLAAQWGLVNETVPDDEVMARAQQVAAELAAGATVAIGLTKQLVHAGLGGDLDATLRREGPLAEIAIRSNDFKEGVAAFREKRSPRFTGR